MFDFSFLKFEFVEYKKKRENKVVKKSEVIYHRICFTQKSMRKVTLLVKND